MDGSDLHSVRFPRGNADLRANETENDHHFGADTRRYRGACATRGTSAGGPYLPGGEAHRDRERSRVLATASAAAIPAAASLFDPGGHSCGVDRSPSFAPRA